MWCITGRLSINRSKFTMYLIKQREYLFTSKPILKEKRLITKQYFKILNLLPELMKTSPARERKTYKFMFMKIFCYFIFKVDYKHIYVRRIYLKMTYGSSFPLQKLGLGKPQNIREILCRDFKYSNEKLHYEKARYFL